MKHTSIVLWIPDTPVQVQAALVTDDDKMLSNLPQDRQACHAWCCSCSTRDCACDMRVSPWFNPYVCSLCCQDQLTALAADAKCGRHQS
jgi:hypothetical protein